MCACFCQVQICAGPNPVLRTPCALTLWAPTAVFVKRDTTTSAPSWSCPLLLVAQSAAVQYTLSGCVYTSAHVWAETSVCFNRVFRFSWIALFMPDTDSFSFGLPGLGTSFIRLRRISIQLVCVCVRLVRGTQGQSGLRRVSHLAGHIIFLEPIFGVEGGTHQFKPPFKVYTSFRKEAPGVYTRITV